MCLVIHGYCPSCGFLSSHEEVYTCEQGSTTDCPGKKQEYRCLSRSALTDFYCVTKGCRLSFRKQETELHNLRKAVYNMRAEFDGKASAHVDDFGQPAQLMVPDDSVPPGTNELSESDGEPLTSEEQDGDPTEEQDEVEALDTGPGAGQQVTNAPISRVSNQSATSLTGDDASPQKRASVCHASTTSTLGDCS